MYVNNTSKFILAASQKHENEYDYSLSKYITSKDLIQIICRTHGSFWQTARSHLNGSGCTQCAIERNAKHRRNDLDTILQKFTNVHGYRYDYSLVKALKIHDKVEIICREHGSFYQSIANHTAGNGCPRCSAKQTSKRCRHDVETTVQKFIQTHGHRYDYSLIDEVHTVSDKVQIICRVHGVFSQRISHHIDGCGCPKCYRVDSRTSNSWLDSLNISSLIREHRLPELMTRPVDAYDPATNTVYQFHGDYWHGNLAVYDRSKIHKHTGKTMGELYDKTLLFDQQLRDLGYNLVVMWEYDWIKQRSNPHTPSNSK